MTQTAELPLQAFSSSLSHLVASIAPGIVAITSRRTRTSGFVWRPGLVVTADEALAEEGEIAITPIGGTAMPAQIVGRDPSTDIALLRMEDSSLQPLALVEASLSVGELSIAIGASEDGPIAALGIIARASGAWQSMRGGEIAARVALDLRLRREAEGGVAADAAGRVIGMTVFGPRQQVLVIPTATIARVANLLVSQGRVPRGYLGLSLQPVALEGGARGAMVMGVDPQGPGAASGIHLGDVIVSWNDEAIDGVRSIQRALGPQSVGAVVSLELRRAGERQVKMLTIAERPAA